MPPMVVEHVEFNRPGATYTLPLPEGWTYIVYVRRGSVAVGGGVAGEAPSVAGMYETVYLSRRGGDGLVLTNAECGRGTPKDPRW